MRRERIGSYERLAVAGSQARTFIPAPLPPRPALDLSVLQGPLAKALVGLGRLDSISTLLPDPGLFLYSYVRKEAVLSSQIEGTRSTLSHLLLFELKAAPGVPLDDVTEVSNHVAALEHGMARMRGGFPLSSRLIREMHRLLLSSGRGSHKAPGEFRRSQVWIGGARPDVARFVPPPWTAVESCIADLERFLHTEDESLAPPIRAGLAHLQFETIHPFLDGNGRVGRILIPLILCQDRVLTEPLLYLSLYLKERRDEYYEHLNRVRRTGDWETWLRFFLEGVASVAQGAVGTAHRLIALFDESRARIQREGRAAGSMLRVIKVLEGRAISPIAGLAERTGLSVGGAAAAVARLEELGIVREITGFRRNRLFAYDRYLSILNEGTDPP